MNRLIPIAFFALASWQLDTTAATPDFMLVEMPAVHAAPSPQWTPGPVVYSAPYSSHQELVEAAYTQWRAGVISKGNGTRAIVTFNLDPLADRYWLGQCQQNGWDFFSMGKTQRWKEPRASRCIVAGGTLVHEDELVRTKPLETPATRFVEYRSLTTLISTYAPPTPEAPVLPPTPVAYFQPAAQTSYSYAPQPSFSYAASTPVWAAPRYSVCGPGGCP